jgi:hypothetical protein
MGVEMFQDELQCQSLFTTENFFISYITIRSSRNTVELGNSALFSALWNIPTSHFGSV